MTAKKSTLPQVALTLVAAAVLGATASVASAQGNSGNGAAEKVRVIVGFQPGAKAAAAARDAIARHGGRVDVDLGEVDAVAIELPRAAVAALQRSQGVAYVEEDAERRALALATPSDFPYEPGQLVPYGIPMVQADMLGDDVAFNRKVCIVDSGYETAHEDLAGNTVAGENLTRSGKWYTDESGHGTHVGGTISAVNNPNVGVVGVLPNKRISLYIAKVFDASGTAASSKINRAALNCVKKGANIVSMSLGGDTPTRTDERVFNKIAAQNVLVVAAAGNAGTNAISYPAGYASVMSVAAVDQNKQHASFSQFNSTVEIAAPGVGVLSTVPMGSNKEATLTVNSNGYLAIPMEGTPNGNVTAPLVDFGIGDTVNNAVAGSVCLIQRGTISFAQKVLNCQTSGGVAAVIYNNAAGELVGTLGGTATTIPSVGVSDTTGAALAGQLGASATLVVQASNYAYFDGTSMATPHVAAVAALVWSNYPNCTAAQIRATLTRSALDLGAPGRDDQTGYGLVQALAAVYRIEQYGCGN